MTISKEKTGECMKICLEGRLDTMTAPELETELNQVMGTVNELVFDFDKLEYISSAGLRVLLSAHKAMSKKGGMKVTHVNEIVQEVFDVTGFSDILTIE
jgi:anti-sigma B factor antagonist